MEFDEYFSTDNVISVFNSRLKNSDVVGADGMRAKKFAEDINNQVEIIVRKCLEGTYKFTTFKERLIPKDAHSKPRQISIPTIRDALVLRILCDLLKEKFPDQKLSRPHYYITDIRNILDTQNTGDTFLRLDVKEFYPSINWAILKKKLEVNKIPDIAINLIMAAITNKTGTKKSPSMNRNATQKLSISSVFTLVNCAVVKITNQFGIRYLPSMNRGVPQGLSISNILASIYFSEIDDCLERESGGRYFRYVDDILFICDKTEYEMLRKKTEYLLKSKLKLSVHKPGTSSASKSTTRPTSEGIDYLGFHITAKNLKVRQGSCEKVFEAVVNLVTSYARNYENYPAGCPRNRFRERFLWKLNLRITGCRLNEKSIGWMFFFRQTKDIKQIKRLDTFVAKIFNQRGLSEELERVKKFTKTYYEIRYKRKQTRYIPDFDNLTKKKKIAELARISGKNPDDFKPFTNKQINEIFRYTIMREVRHMEWDVLDFAKGYY